MSETRVGDAWAETGQGCVFFRTWVPQGETTPALAPIVLLHDSLGSVSLWRDFPAQLAAATGREVVAYDRLGFGLSDPFPGRLPASFIRDEAHGAFAAVIAQLRAERFVAFGHSVGGGMAVECAAAYADRCEALITVSAQAFVEDRTLAGIRAAEQAFAAPELRQRLQKYHGDKAEWVLRAWIETWLAPAFRDWTLDEALAAVRCPTLVIHGEADEYGSPAHPARIASGISARIAVPARTELLAGCGHMPHRERTDDVLALTAALLSVG